MLFTPGFIPGSIPFDPDNIIITPGLAKAIKTVAAAFNPGVCAKISIDKPRKNEEMSNNQPGVSNGSNNTNNT